MGGYWGTWGQRPFTYGTYMGWTSIQNTNNPEDNGAFEWSLANYAYYYSCQFGRHTASPSLMHFSSQPVGLLQHGGTEQSRARLQHCISQLYINHQ
jgi:hypothetical protein